MLLTNNLSLVACRPAHARHFLFSLKSCLRTQNGRAAESRAFTVRLSLACEQKMQGSRIEGVHSAYHPFRGSALLAFRPISLHCPFATARTPLDVLTHRCNSSQPNKAEGRSCDGGLAGGEGHCRLRDGPLLRTAPKLPRTRAVDRAQQQI